MVPPYIRKKVIDRPTFLPKLRLLSSVCGESGSLARIQRRNTHEVHFNPPLSPTTIEMLTLKHNKKPPDQKYRKYRMYLLSAIVDWTNRSVYFVENNKQLQG